MKKIFAKEFLILLSVVIISIITFPITYGYNVYLSHNTQTLEDSITIFDKNIDALEQNYNKKIEVQNEVFNLGCNFFNNVGYGKQYETRYQFWNVLLSDNNYKNFMSEYNSSRRSFWKTYSLLRSDHINSFESFKAFLRKYTVNEKEQSDYETAISNYNYRTNIKSRIHILYSKMLNEKQQINFATNTFYIFFIISFLLRYLIISVKWSIKQIKS